MIDFIKRSVGIQLVLLLLLTSFLSNLAHAKDMRAVWAAKAAPIKVIDVTPDGKYPVYGLVHEEDDIVYHAGNLSFTFDDLSKKLVYLSKEDKNNGVYTCEYVCRDKKGRIVGIDPVFK